MEKFQEQFAAIEFVLLNLKRAISLLGRISNEEVVLDRKDKEFVKLATTHYVINNLTSLFDTRSDCNSLKTLPGRFQEPPFGGHFVEFDSAVEAFRQKHSADLERMRRNRNLSSGHLGGSPNQRLGYNTETATRLNELFGGQSPVAEKGCLEFITPKNLLLMPVVQALPELEDILKKLFNKICLEEALA